jgi:hypothetical protein
MPTDHFDGLTGMERYFGVLKTVGSEHGLDNVLMMTSKRTPNAQPELAILARAAVVDYKLQIGAGFLSKPGHILRSGSRASA